MGEPKCCRTTNRLNQSKIIRSKNTTYLIETFFLGLDEDYETDLYSSLSTRQKLFKLPFSNNLIQVLDKKIERIPNVIYHTLLCSLKQSFNEYTAKFSKSEITS